MTVTNTPSEPTALERDLFELFFRRYKEAGFPKPDDIRVTSRENTGAGRFTHILHEGSIAYPDGELGLGKFSQLNMEGLEAGASFWIEVEKKKLTYLEIVVNGEESWDGSEGKWQVCDPDTGMFSAD